MPKTYEPIATTTTTGTASIDWQSISGAYTDLILVAVGTENAVGGGYFRVILNNDGAGTTYSRTMIRGNGSSASSARSSNEPYWVPDFSTNPSNAICHFMNYSNTTTFKTMIGRWNQTSATVVAQVNLWRNTAAINRITLESSAGGNTLIGTFTLYGIAAA
jgi:hypothetical protein